MQMTHTHTYRGIVWLDLECPTDDEIGSLVKRYGLHPLVGEELKTSTAVAKIDTYPDYILIVLTLPVRTRTKNGYEIHNREIDFVIGKNFLITARTETIEQLEYFGKIFEANTILNKDEKIEHAGFIFYYIVKRMYTGLVEDLENIKDSLSETESRIYHGDERKMVEVLSNLSRELIDIKQTARMHHDIWDEMLRNVGFSLNSFSF
jgi:magnesium transporter